MADTLGPCISKGDLLRLASTQILAIQGDAAQLGIIVAHLTEGDSEFQAIDNAFDSVHNLKSSLSESNHLLCCVALDPFLRDNPIIYDGSGVSYIYRGCNVHGMCISSPSGEYQHVVRIVTLTDEGFVGERDHQPAEEWRCPWKNSSRTLPKPEDSPHGESPTMDSSAPPDVTEAFSVPSQE